MNMLNKLINYIVKTFEDKNFLKLIHSLENLISKILSIALIVVIFVSLVDLFIILSQNLFSVEPKGFFSETLIELFGLFLNILIALEVLDNITVYLKQNVVKLELVLITALMAVARKIIIFDSKKYDEMDFIALGITIVCLAGSYWLVRYNNSKKP